MSSQLAAALDVARDVAWQPHVNLNSAARYAERREAFALLRAAMAERRGYRHGLSANASPQLTALLDAIDRLADCTHANVMGLPYYERKQAMAELRGCFDQWDQSNGDARTLWPGMRFARVAA